MSVGINQATAEFWRLKEAGELPQSQSDLVQEMDKIWRECVAALGDQPFYYFPVDEKFYQAYRWSVRSGMLVFVNRKKGRKSLRFNRRRLAHISKGNNR